jgi:hypothetical protein
MKIEDHSGTVTPVISFPHEIVIEPLLPSLSALEIAARAGGSEAAPTPAPVPAAT